MDALRVALNVVFGGLLSGCHSPSRTVRVIATDYALQAPDTVGPGTTEFVLQNRGRVVHELIIGLLRPGAGLAEMVAAGQHNARFRDLGSYYLDGPPFGAVMAWPGVTSPSRLVTDLQAGHDYALLCQLRDTTTSPQHTMLGMVHVLHVR